MAFEYEQEIKNLAKFYNIYDLVRASGGATEDELKKWLVSSGMPETSARRLVKEFCEEWSGLLLDYDEKTDKSIISATGVSMFLVSLGEWLDVKIYDQDNYDDGIREVEKKVLRVKEEKLELKRDNIEFQALNHSQEKFIEKLNDENSKLQNKIIELSTKLETMRLQNEELKRKGESLWHKIKKHVNWKSNYQR